MAITTSLRKFYSSAQSGLYVFQTLEFRHPQFTAAHRITNNVKEIVVRLEDGTNAKFIGLPFGIRMPARDSNGRQDLSIEVDNVDRQIMEEIDLAARDYSTHIQVTFREYTSDYLDAPAANPITLAITDVEISAKSVNLTATRADILNRVFPALLYKTHYFPGLDR